MRKTRNNPWNWGSTLTVIRLGIELSEYLREQTVMMTPFYLKVLIANVLLLIDRINDMDLDALKKFIEDKGNQRKKDLYDACIFQTKDAEKTKLLSDKIQRELD